MSKVALVTGGSRGIGAATAIRLAQDGFDVCVNYVADREAANIVTRDIQRLGRKAIAVCADVSSESDVQGMFEAAQQRLGQLTALVNNAGILFSQARLVEMSAGRMEQIMRVNVLGTLLCCREAVSRMSTRLGGQGGVIVNVSSAAARLGSPNEYVDYAASKGALDTLTIGLAGEVANEGIRVNAVRPGFIYTDMHALGGESGRVDRLKKTLPMQRGGQPEEVAASIAFLVSEQSSYTTGAFIDVSGGR